MPPIQPSQHPPGGGTRSLSETLLLTTAAATTRTEEAMLMFGGVASALDEASRGANAPIIPQHLANTYQLFIERVQEVTQDFFDNHVRGLPNTAATQRGNTDTRSARQQTQAGNFASTKPRRPARAQRQNDISQPTDDRLFLRLEQDATERLISAYPLLLHYRKFLGANASLLKEVQHVPSGIALRPSSEDAASRLESPFSVGIEEGKLKGSTGIEKTQNLVSYLLTSIPRSFTALDDNNQLTNYPITEDLVRAELTEEKGLYPISVHETKESTESHYYSSARYIARFPIGTILPRKFYLFGVEVLSRQLAKRTSVIQCSRCFQWHNEIICSRAPRCRLCGSIEHLEANHQPCGPHPYHCTPRCIHCHGPHPADAPECPLRPRRNGLKLSKEQISQIRQTSAAARLSLSATVRCLHRPSPFALEDHVMTEETFPKFPSNHPFSTLTTTAMQLDIPSSNQLVRASSPSLPLSTTFTKNSYAPLSDRDEGNVLDLSFPSNSLILAGAELAIIPELDVTSDHLPIGTIIPWDSRFQEPVTRLKIDTLDENLFHSLLQAEMARMPSLPVHPQPASLDTYAEILCTALQNSFRGSARRALGRGTGQPWWNDECRDAARAHRIARRNSQDPTACAAARKELRIAVRRAKRQFFRNLLDQASSAKDVFKMVNWHRSVGSFRTPPLRDPTNPAAAPVVSLEDKRDVLARNLLRNTSEADDIPLDAPTVGRAILPFPDLTLHEIRDSILGAGNTAPGEDEIPTAILKKIWSLIGSPVTNLFRSCLNVGFHPTCFKKAILVMVSKPNKLDKSNPRSFRPIALLSVLGKGLERLVARRLSWVVINGKVLASQQFGATPLRSATDLTTCLVYDVETALNSKLTASVLTLDVKGAFDGILPGRLVRRLREQGWSQNQGPLWVTPGIPSIPNSIYALPFSSLLLRFTPKKFGYADDVTLLRTSSTLQENAALLSRDLQEAIDWGQAEGITFDSGKYELLHFTRHRADQDPRLTPSRADQDPRLTPRVRAGPLTIAKNMSHPYTRWLGILFDKKLSFKWHVRSLAAKALKVSNALSSLGNTVRGVPAHLLRHAAVACVLPVAYYGSEAWWPGRSRQGTQGRISNRVDSLLQLLDKVILTSACAIVPVYRTTPTAALHRESGLTPSEIALNGRTTAATARLRHLDPRHPLLRRAGKIISLNRPTPRFARRVLALPQAEQINLIALPPWAPREGREEAYARVGGPCGALKEMAKQAFNSFISSIPSGDIILYIDGSKQADGFAGAGCVAYQGGIHVTADELYYACSLCYA
ncbi:hypothetical protein K3495_g9581 [Podosphaera aphanis]|nr:hypothetical protein K3495_g9581 [Podosphaera aphanis]